MNVLDRDVKFRYQLLDRMRQDVGYCRRLLLSAKEDKNESNADFILDKDREEILKDFSYKLLNFTSIDDRNDEIKNYLTNKCIKEQGLDVKVNADFNSIGSIEHIYQETDNVNHYSVLGNDKSRGAEHDVLIDVTFEKDKINSFSIKYMELR